MSRMHPPILGSVAGLAFVALLVWASGWVPERGATAVLIVLISALTAFVGWTLGQIVVLERKP